MSLSSETLTADLGSLKRHALVGIIAIVFGFGGLCFWAANTEISGAVIAAGQMQVESFAKQIQHQDGGIVKQINVHDNDPVKEGDILVVLDDTDIRASLSVVTDQLNEAYVEEARLVAQIAGTATFNLPTTVDAKDTAIQSLEATQQQILSAQIADRAGRVAQLNEQIQQLNHQVDGLQMQQDADDKQISILDQRSSDMEKLLTSQLAQASDVTNLHLQQAAADGDRGRLIAAIAQTKATVSEKQAAIDQTNADFMSQALDDLQKTRQTIAQARQQQYAGQAKLDRTIIRAPQTGVVHESIVHTIGGVITPGQTIMEIVPNSDTLLVGIHIDPNDIQSVYQGQAVNLRFSSLDRRRTPEAWGKIDSVSPDLVVQQQTGRAYYTANVRIDPDQLAKLPTDLKLMPGMPVQAFVTTGDRSVLSYLVHPLVEEMQLAFREP